MTRTAQIELRWALPEVTGTRDACVGRLIDQLLAKEGIEATHLIEAEAEAPDRFCIHYDPSQLSVGDVREAARRAGALLHERYGHLLLRTAPMHARKARTVAARAGQIPGVLEAAASADGFLRIEFDRQLGAEEAIRSALHGLGVERVEDEARPVPATGRSRDDHADHAGLLGEHSELIFALACGVCLLAGWLLAMLTPVTPWAPRGLYIASYLLGGFFTLREAIQNLRAGRFEIDFLMLVAAAGAAALGEWAEGALLLLLFSLGHALEHFAMGRARGAIEGLADLAPASALVRRQGRVEEIPVEQLTLGDVVVVKPNAKIPADGFVSKGESSVDQAPITGESVPVDKGPVPDPTGASEHPGRLEARHRVFAGTINQSGALEIVVTKLAADSTLSRVVRMVHEADTRISPTQRFTDKFERAFVPAVLGFVVLLLFAWVVKAEPFSASFYRAMAVLVAASPCALAIATPSAVLSAVARAARGGVLVKGGGPLESLGKVEAMAFDKTGTLTEGRPRLTEVVPGDGVSEATLLAVAVAVESLSDHPLAAAVARDGRARLASGKLNGADSPPDGMAKGVPWLPDAQDLRSLTGRGVMATVGGQIAYIGKDDLFAEVEGPPLPEPLRAQVEALESDGRTTMIVRQGDRYLGVLALMDAPRRSSKEMITRLRELGIRRMILISGDNQQVADAVASEVGIDEAWGDLMPEDKVESIQRLREHGGVAMVGDGVNDAPAMANATVGIAMGASGSDVALETADIALMADDLSQLPFAVGLSRKTSRIIRQNLWFSLGMVALLVPATVLGLRMGVAVLFHEGSTLLVVANALRLLRYREPRARFD